MFPASRKLISAGVQVKCCSSRLPVEYYTQSPCSRRPKPSAPPPRTPAPGTRTPWTAIFSRTQWSTYWLRLKDSPVLTSSCLLLHRPGWWKQVHPGEDRTRDKRVRFPHRTCGILCPPNCSTLYDNVLFMSCRFFSTELTEMETCWLVLMLRKLLFRIIHVIRSNINASSCFSSHLLGGTTNFLESVLPPQPKKHQDAAAHKPPLSLLYLGLFLLHLFALTVTESVHLPSHVFWA